MTINPFFKNKGPFKIEKLLKLSGIDNKENFIKSKISDISDLSTTTKDNITFFHSKKYEELASKTKASFCITTDNLKDYLPNRCNKIIVDNVLIATAKITKVFYPDSITDDFDMTVQNISKTLFKKKVKYGKNVLVGKNTKIGKNCLIGGQVGIAGHLIIEDTVTIAAKSGVTKNIKKNSIIAGFPAVDIKIWKKNIINQYRKIK